MLQRIHDLIVAVGQHGVVGLDGPSPPPRTKSSQLRDEIDRIGTRLRSATRTCSTAASVRRRCRSRPRRPASPLVSRSPRRSPTFDLDAGDTGPGSLSVDGHGARRHVRHGGVVPDRTADRRQRSHDRLTAGFTGGVTVKVTDLGSGVWTVNFTRNSTALGHAASRSATSVVRRGASAVDDQRRGDGGEHGRWRVPGRCERHGAEPDPGVDRRHPDHRRHEQHVHRACRRSTSPTRPTTVQRAASSTVRFPRCRLLRGQLGADQNRFQSTISNLQVTTENLSASESRIRDTDMASEMVNFTKDQILLQAGTAMLAQANAAPQTVLQLLQ